MRRMLLIIMLLATPLLAGGCWWQDRSEEIASRTLQIQSGDLNPTWITDPVKVTRWAMWRHDTVELSAADMLAAKGSYLVPYRCSWLGTISIKRWGDPDGSVRYETEQPYSTDLLDWWDGEWIALDGIYKTIWRKVGREWMLTEAWVIISDMATVSAPAPGNRCLKP